jgi:hypothetical protein
VNSSKDSPWGFAVGFAVGCFVGCFVVNGFVVGCIAGAGFATAVLELASSWVASRGSTAQNLNPALAAPSFEANERDEIIIFGGAFEPV